MVPEGSSEVVCKGVFGMLMLNTATMSPSARLFLGSPPDEVLDRQNMAI